MNMFDYVSNDWGIYLIVVCVFIVFDFITGFAQAIANKTVDSSIMRRGLWHKLGIILAFFFAVGVNMTVCIIDLGVDIPAVEVVTVYLVLMEARSIWENITILNPDVINIFRFDNDKSDNEE